MPSHKPPSYLGFSYLGCGVPLHGCSSKAQPLLLTLDEGHLLTAAPPALECGVALLGPPAAPWRWGSSSRAGPLASGLGKLLSLLLRSLELKAATPDLGEG